MSLFSKTIDELIDSNDPAEVALGILAVSAFDGKLKEQPVVTKSDWEIAEWQNTDDCLAERCVRSIIKYKQDKAKLSAGTQETPVFNINIVSNVVDTVTDPIPEHIAKKQAESTEGSPT